MIRCCRRARVADAGNEDEDEELEVKLEPILASGCVTTSVSSESDDAAGDDAVAVAVVVLKQFPFSRSAR